MWSVLVDNSGPHTYSCAENNNVADQGLDLACGGCRVVAVVLRITIPVCVVPERP